MQDFSLGTETYGGIFKNPAPRWFRFSLRTLFIVMTICCVGLGPVLRARRQHAAVQWAKQYSSIIVYDWQLDAQGNMNKKAAPPGPAWLRDPWAKTFSRRSSKCGSFKHPSKIWRRWKICQTSERSILTTFLFRTLRRLPSSRNFEPFS